MESEEIAVFINQVAVERQGRALKDVECLVLKAAWENKTYAAMATPEAGYTEDYLKKDVGPKLWQLLTELVRVDLPGIRVTKRNIQSVLQTWLAQRGRTATEIAPRPTLPAAETSPARLTLAVRDSPRIDLAGCGGREAELATLTGWVLGQGAGPCCRTIVLWGLPGVGKTTLVAAVAAAVAAAPNPPFDRCGYLALPAGVTDGEGLGAIAHWIDPAAPIVTSLATPLATADWAIDQFDQHRLLLILDDMDHLFAPQQLAGTYRPATEGLHRLFLQAAERHHQSCLIWVSREKPTDLPQVQGPRVQEFALGDLGPEAARLLLQPAAGPSSNTDRAADWAALVARYGGHPLVLRGVGATLRDLYQGQPRALLQGAAVTVPAVVSQRFGQALERLQPQEWALLYWLALAQGPVARDDLNRAMHPAPDDNAVQSVLGRAWVLSQTVSQSGLAGGLVLSLAPVVQTLVLDRLRGLLLGELESESLHWFQRLPLVTVTAQEGVQARQRAALLTPLSHDLRQRYPTEAQLVAKGDRWLAALRSLAGQPGYGAGNLLHLCQALGLGVSGADFAHLSLWQADLRRVSLQGANFSQAQFSDTVFATALGRHPVASFSPDGRHLATGDQEGRLLLWDLARGKLVWMFDEGQSQGVCALAFNPQGDLLAVGTETGAIWLWPVGATYQTDVLSYHRVAVRALAFSPDGSQLASGDDSGQLCLWEVASGFAQHCLAWHEGAIHSLAYNTTGDRLVSGADDQRACLWQVAEGTAIQTFHSRPTAHLRTAGFLPDPHDPGCPPIPFAAGYDDHCLTIWNLATGLPCWIVPTEVQALPAMAISPNGRHLVCSRQDFTVAVWHIPERRICYTLPSAGAPVWTLTLSADSRHLVTGSNYSLNLWTVRDGQGWRSFGSQAHPVRCLALGMAADNASGAIVTGHDDPHLRLWQVTAGSRYAVGPRTLTGHDAPVRAVALSGDGQWLASSGDDRTLRLWAIASGQPQWVAATPAPATLLAISPDSQWVASASPEGHLRLWDRPTGNPVGDLDLGSANPSALAFSPDSQWLLVGSRDGSLELWRVHHRCRQHRLGGHRGQVRGLAMGADGVTVASASHDGTVRWWSLAGSQGDGDRPLAPQGQWRHPNEQWLQGVTLSPTDDPLAITSDGAQIEVWAVATNQCRHRLVGHSQAVWHGSPSPSRTHLITASHDDEIRVWSLASGHCQQTLRPDRPYEGVNIRGATGLSETEVRMLKSLGAIVSYGDS